MRQDGWVTQEVMTVGGDAPDRGFRREPSLGVWVAVGLVAAAVLSIVAIATMVEWTARTVEADQLLVGVSNSEAVMKAAQGDFAEIFAQLDDETLTEGQRAELVADLSVISQAAEIAIAEAGERVAAVTIWPWHTRLVDAQKAYLAHNNAWVDYMSAASEDPAELVRPQEAVNDTFVAARDPLWRMIPRFDPLDLRAEVVAIYADDEPNGSSGGGGVPA